MEIIRPICKKGETGIRILAPIVRKVDEEKNGTTEKVSRPFGFRTVSVFAQEQTDGQPLPELNTNAAEGGETLLPLLEKAAAQLNITLVYKAIAGSAEGYSKGGLIEDLGGGVHEFRTPTCRHGRSAARR